MKKLLVLYILLMIRGGDSFSQSDVNAFEGTSFVVGFMHNRNPPESEVRSYQTLIISSRFNTHVRVEMPFYNWLNEFFLPADSIVELTIPRWYAEQTTFGTIENRGIFISSTESISVFASSWQRYSHDATPIFPIDYLGDDYFTIAHENTIFGLNTADAEYMIVATENNTSIQITYPSSATTNIILNKGQTYQYKTNEISGIHIKGNSSNGTCKPFAVFTGAQAGSVPSNCTNALDHTYDQMLPMKDLGTKFYLTPIKLANNYRYKFVATQDATSIVVNNSPAVVLNTGQMLTFSGGIQSQVILADKPIMVQQYLFGHACGGNGWGDPAAASILPSDKRINYVKFKPLVTENIDTVFVGIVIESAYINSIFLDNTPISPLNFKAFQFDSTMSYASIPVELTDHFLSSKHNFQAFTYGLANGKYESYMYNFGYNKGDEMLIIDSSYCDFGDTLHLQAAVNFQDVWWSAYDTPQDTIVFNDSLTLVNPITSNLYVCHGVDITSQCPQEIFFSVEDTSGVLFSIGSSEDTVCQYGSIKLTANSNFNSDLYSVTWSPPYYFKNETGFETEINLVETGWYYATLSSIGSGCTNLKDSVFLVVNPTSSISSHEINLTKAQLCGGDTAQINLSVFDVLLQDLFTNSIDNTIWENSNGVIAADSCSSVTGKAAYFYGGVSRFMESFEMDLSNGGRISFYAKASNESGACDSTEFGDNLMIEYSIDGGSTWDSLSTIFEYLAHDLSHYSIKIPLAAETPNTKIRIVQNNFEAIDKNIWIVDNFILELNTQSYGVSWHPNYNISSINSYSPFVSPDTSMWYTVTIANGSCSITDSVFVKADNFTLSIDVDSSACFGGQVVLTALPSDGDNYNYYWGSNYLTKMGLNNSQHSTFVIDSNMFDQIFYVTAISKEGCAQKDSAEIKGFWNSHYELATDTTICFGDSTHIEFFGYDVIKDDFNYGSFNNSLWLNIVGGTITDSLGSMFSTALLLDSSLRYAETKDFDMSNGGRVHFSVSNGPDMYGYTPNSNTSYISLYGRLEYSIDSGATWIMLASTHSKTTGFNSYAATLNSYGETPATRFKFRQHSASANGTNPVIYENIAITKAISKFTYSWQYPLGNVISTEKTVDLLLPNSGYVYLEITDTVKGCARLDSVFIHVGPMLDPGLSDMTICNPGDTAHFIPNLPPGPTYSYTWDLLNFTWNGTDSIFSFPANGKFMFVELELSSSEGCSIKDTFQVYSPFAYNKDLNIIGDTLVCVGDQTNLRAEVAYEKAVIDWVGAEPYATWNSSQSAGVSSIGYDCDVLPTGFVTSVVRGFQTQLPNRYLTMATWAGYGSVNALEYMCTYGTGACDGPEPGEEVIFQYSQNLGVTWTNLDTLEIAEHSGWTKVYTKLPPGVHLSNTWIRWIQPNHSQVYKDDMWMITNIRYLEVPEQPLSYEWTVESIPSFSDTSKITSLGIFSPAYYAVKVIDTSGCYQIDSVLVNSVNINLDAGLDTAMCVTTGYVLQGSTDSPLPYNIKWQDPSSALTNVNTLNPAMEVQDSLQFVLGLSYGNCIVHDTVVISDQANTPIPLIADTSGCPGDLVTLYLPGANSINWSPIIDITGENNDTTNFIFNNSMTYYVNYGDSASCVHADSVIFNVYSETPILMTSDTSVCQDENVLIDISGAFDMIWSPSYGIVASSTTSPVFLIDTSISYALVYKDVNGCELYDTINFDVELKPLVNLPADTTACVMNPFLLNSNANVINGTYLWNTGETTNSIIANSTGLYWVELSTACGIDIDSVLITQIDGPDITTIVSGITIYSNQFGADSYQWLDCAALFEIPGETNQQFTPIIDGSYACIVNVQGCIDTTACVEISFSSIHDEDGLELKVQPNPFTHSTTLFFGQTINGDISIFVANTLGQIVFEKQNIIGDNVSIPRGDLASGIYFIHCYSESLEVNEILKIVIE